jgi:hypothetical protein
MKSPKLFLVVALVFAGLSLGRAADLAGKWTAEFDSPIGVQKYVYAFKIEGDKITGKATFDHSMGKGDAELKDIKVSKDDVAFTEKASFGGNELVITYTGKIAGDELKLKRVVGDFGSEDLVAKRAKSESKPAAK